MATRERKDAKKLRRQAREVGMSSVPVGAGGMAAPAPEQQPESPGADRVSISIRLPVALRDELLVAASNAGVSVNAFISLAVWNVLHRR